MATFAELGLSEPLLDALQHLGYEQPTPIQEQAIPGLLEGRDIIGQAQTGTGKTAAFGLPLLQYIDVEDHEVQALVLTPTRELCIQVTQALRAYGEKKGVKVVAVFGGAPIRTQQAQLKEGAQVVVGTVGRVMDLMSRHSLMLTSARFVVLDEADEMLDLGFLEDVEMILSRCPSGRQTALFSATMPPEIRKLAEKGMYDPTTIKVRAATLTIDSVEQFFVEVTDREKADALARVLKAERPTQAIIFGRTKIGVDRLARSLNDKGLRVKALHGDMSQGSRDGVMIAFKDGREKLLIATDIAARGLDISGVSHVINYDMPNSPDVYVHRIGRTGRVGRSGRAITLVTPKQLRDLDAVRKHANTEIHPWSENGKPPAPPERAAEEVIAPVATNGADPEPPEEKQPRRPRHTKPRRAPDVPRTKLLVGAGRARGLEPADVVSAIVDNSHLDGEDVSNVRVLERFSFVEVPGERAGEVVEKVNGQSVRGVELRLEVANR
ncbi:MAG: ATP-dependent helicase DeaD [Thermoleophilaceae bacterium]|jgi:ATP-dependent RNA helicase DeaD|nr:ATP-dependent helicase DeaD [Thermoleophilaceae bacterium]